MTLENRSRPRRTGEQAEMIDQLELRNLRAQRDWMLEACKQILPWARQARFDCDFYSQAAADAQRIIDDVESAIAACES